MNINVLKQLNTRSKRALRHSVSINSQPAICIERRSHVVVVFSSVLSGPRFDRWSKRRKERAFTCKKFITILLRFSIKWLIGNGLVKSGFILYIADMNQRNCRTLFFKNFTNFRQQLIFEDNIWNTIDIFLFLTPEIFKYLSRIMENENDFGDWTFSH